MDELDLGTDLDYKDLGDNARKNDRTGMIQTGNILVMKLQSWTWAESYRISKDLLKTPLNDVKNKCNSPPLVRPTIPDCPGSFSLPRIPKRKQTDTKDQIKQGTLDSY